MALETIFNFLLFLLALLLSYGFLAKLKILPRTSNMIVSLVIAFYFLFIAVTSSQDFTQIFAFSVLILFVAFIIIAAVKGGKETHKRISEKTK